MCDAHGNAQAHGNGNLDGVTAIALCTLCSQANECRSDKRGLWALKFQSWFSRAVSLLNEPLDPHYEIFVFIAPAYSRVRYRSPNFYRTCL